MKFSFGNAIALTVLGVAMWSAAHAATAPSLGTASTYAIIAGAMVPGEPGVATQAQVDVLNAYTNIGNQACTQSATGALGNITMTPGVLCISSTSTWTNGTLTLDAQGNSGAVFLIRDIGNLTLGSGASTTVSLMNGAQANNVYWRVDGALALNGPVSAPGTFIARGSITATSGATAQGHLFSTEGTVSAATSSVSCAGCITNHPTLTLFKNVTNNNGGAATAGSFVLLMNGMDTISGRVNLLAPGVYAIDELDAAGYSGPVITGACAPNGSVSLAAGENKTCTLTNDDVGLPNTGAGGSFADALCWLLRTGLIAGAAGGIGFFGFRAARR